MSRESFSPTSLISVSDAGLPALAESIGIETADLLARLDDAGRVPGPTTDVRSCGVDC